ncbi:MAG: class II glutamine amidotransferase, partial [Candidatus Bathyarchaeia archaeon]
MCGIFGFSLKKPVALTKVFKALRRLEVHQYPDELKPVGGFGAGVAFLGDDGEVIWEKVGSTEGGSPAEKLARMVKQIEARVLVAHVRMPSQEFMTSASFKETAQPYVVSQGETAVVSVHNGKIENYKELRAKLGVNHAFESERKVELIDSEVIPHVFAELLQAKHTDKTILENFLHTIEGSNTIAILHINKKKEAFLYFVHKGKTRGLHVWSNESGEEV